jgi:general secretion pathway protein F
MPIFHYKGYKQDGKETSGTISAESIRDARERLKGSGILLSAIDAEGEGKRPAGIFKFRKTVGLPELALLTRRLATLVGASMPLFEAVATLMEQERPGEMRSVLSRVKEKLAEGKGLATALSDESRLFNDSYISMVAAGEASGALDTVLEKLADFLEEQEAIRSRVTTALAYPILMAIVGTGVMLFLLAFVIPKISAVFADNKAALPLITIILLKVSAIVRQGWWLLLAASAAAVFAYRRMIRDEKFRLKRDTLLLKIPGFGSLFQKLLLARFAKILGLLLSSGVPVIRAMEITSEAVVNRAYRLFLSEAKGSIIEGGKLSAALSRSPLFPPILIHMIGIGEQSGTMERMLEKAGNTFEREFDTATTRFMALLEPALVLCMGLAVGFVVVAVLLPIFQLNQLIK